jgi:hypothetical protein
MVPRRPVGAPKQETANSDAHEWGLLFMKNANALNAWLKINPNSKPDKPSPPRYEEAVFTHRSKNSKLGANATGCYNQGPLPSCKNITSTSLSRLSVGGKKVAGPLTHILPRS